MTIYVCGIANYELQFIQFINTIVVKGSMKAVCIRVHWNSFYLAFIV